MEHIRRIGILGGTFDPVHYGHLIMAELARENFALDKVLFIPSGNPPHKSSIKVTQAEQRYAMVCKAIESNGFFEPRRTEIDRTGYTYTVDTLKQLKQFNGEENELYFVIGADVVFDLLNWRSAEEVFQLCRFIAVLRPGYENDSFHRQVEYLLKTHSAVIYTMTMPQLEISSTMIREKVEQGKSIKYLVPDSVEEYIIREGLYKVGDKNKSRSRWNDQGRDEA